MNNVTVKPQNSDLVERFNNAVKKLEQDKKTMEEIKDRNLFQILFSNNTRDLARAGISQTEIISELNAVVQDMLVLIQKSGENQERIMEDLRDSIMRQSGINSDFRNKIIRLAMETLSQSLKIKKIEIATTDQGIRIVSAEQIEKICLDIGEIAQEAKESSLVQFIKICKSAQKFLSASWLSFNDKRKIILAVKQGNFKKISAADINKKRDELNSLFISCISKKTYCTGIWENFLTGQSYLKGEFTMSDAISGVVDAIAISEGDRYTEYRDKLISMIGEFIDKGIDVDNRFSPELTTIRKRLLEGQFEVALVGEFQGGKSTTFNTLCGGREISPRGLNGGGIKTSAAVITAQNISDGEKKNGLIEWAEITWLSIDEIKRRISDVLGIDEKSFSGPDFANLLKKRWEERPVDDDDERDRLRIATLQYRLISSTSFEKICAISIVGINEFQEIVKFPKDWEPRWEKNFDADFTLDECKFSCIDNVLVRLKSPALERLGCRITDCPGLFVSQWDTDKALSVMKRSNAIWYLLNGEKQIGKGDKRALQYIKDWHWEDKCFLSVNRRKSQSTTEDLLRTNASILKTYGFDPNKLFKYNALLSYRLAQLKLYAGNNLSEKDLECLAIEAKPKDVVSDVLREYKTNTQNIYKAIKRLIAKILSNLDEDDLGDEIKDADTLSDELVASLYNEAGINEISVRIEKFIVATRARSILITHGTQKCIEILNALKSRQQSVIDSATQTLEHAEAEAQNSIDKLNKFIADWKERFEFLSIDSWDHDLARDFFTTYGEEMRETITNRAIEICKKEWKSGYYAKDVNKETEKKISTEFLNLIKAKLNEYINDVKNKPVFKANVYDKLLGNLKKLSEEWNTLKKDIKLFEELQIPTIDTIEETEFSDFSENINGTIDVPWYTWELIKDIFTLGIRRFFQSPDSRIDDFFRKENPVGRAYNEFRGNQENEKKVAKFLGAPRITYDTKLNEQFDKMNDLLKGNIKKKKEIVKLSNEGREKAARDAERLLREIITPYMDKITDFENGVRRFYAE